MFTFPKLHKDTNPFCIGALAGAVMAVWVGFDALGWKTATTAEALGKRSAETAMVAAYAGICSVRFNAAADVPARIAELKKVDRWSRGDVVAKTGFATMQGEKEPTSGVSSACADMLIPEKG